MQGEKAEGRAAYRRSCIPQLWTKTEQVEYRQLIQLKYDKAILNRIELCHTTVLLWQIFGQVLSPSSGKKGE